MATDYTRSVGTAGTMIIRDHGTTVEFIIACSDPWTNIGQYNWSGTVNGVGVGGTVSLAAGFGSRSLGSWSVTSTQTVSWTQAATGTQGLGGGATVSASINRGSAPSKPAKPVASNETTSSIEFDWSLPSNNGAGLDQMLLRGSRTTPADLDYWNEAVLPGNATSHTATGLLPGAKYYWCLYAHNANGYSPKSDDTYAPTLPNAPTTPTTSGVSATGMTVAWTKGNNNDAISGYDVQYSTASNFSGATTVSTSSTSRALTGLAPGELYYIRVRAKTAAGTGAWSGTKTQLTSLGTPTGLSTSAVTPVSVTLGWGAVSGAASYDIQYSTSSSFSGATTVNQTGTSRNITGLTPATQYYFRVRAKTADVTGSWSSSVTATTPPSTAPGISILPAPSGVTATVTLTPPSGAMGVTKYTVERRRAGTTTPVTTTDTTSTTLNVAGLTPGTTYEYRATAWFGTYQSPVTSWVQSTQPNPNTNPGDYFDGSTPTRPDLTFSWSSTVNNSTSNANGVGVDGWRAAVAAGGGTVRLQRVSGGRSGAFFARMLVITDASGSGKTLGMNDLNMADAATVEQGGVYVGSKYVRPSRPQQLFAETLWFTDAGVEVLPRAFGEPMVVTDLEGWTRLSATGTAPAGATKAITRARDGEPGSSTGGAGWSPWLSGEWLDVDDIMVTLSTLFDWFSGNTPDDGSFTYEWLGAVDASVSTRTPVTDSSFDPLADPDCDPIPSPPAPPSITDPCITEVGTWRRYWVSFDQSVISRWVDVVPTFRVTTGPEAARQVRIRVFPNPENLPVEQFEGAEGWESEQVISYIPPNTTILLDGVSQRVRASVGGGAWVAADRLLYGANGEPATWPTLDCGIGYMVAFDADVDADPGNLMLSPSLTRRF